MIFYKSIAELKTKARKISSYKSTR